MRFSRAGRLCSAAIVAARLALAPASTLAYNPNNRGHHYGQLKHHQTSPPPTTPPIVNPVTGPTPAVHRATGTDGVPSIPATAIVPLPVALPLPPAVPVMGVATPKGDGISWLALLILPSLVAVWLLVFARGAITMSRRMRRTPVPA